MLVVQHVAHGLRVHRRVPRHVGHEDEQRVDAVRVAAPGVGDHVVHQPVHRERVLPRERLVDAHRAAVVVDEQVVRVRRPAQRHAIEWPVRLNRALVVRRACARRDGPRERRLVAKAAGPVDRAEQRHQDAQRPHRLEAVAVRGESAHRVERDRVAGHRVVLVAPGVGPRDRQLDFLVARGHAHLVREAADRLGRDARNLRGPLGCVVLDAILQQLERGLHRRAVLEREFADERRVGARCVRDHGLVGVPVPPEFVLRVVARFFVGDFGANEHAELVFVRVQVHQLAGVRVLDDEVAVVQTLRKDFVDHREQERAVGAGADRHPFVGDRRVAGAHRVDRDEAPAVAFELGERNLHRVRVMVLRGADHHEQLGAVEIGPAEFPERTADRVDQPRGHVHRTEAAVRGVVGRAELAREQAGQRLHLVAPGEQGELLRIGGANLRQAFRQHRERLFPLDLFEVARAAFGARLAPQRLGQARRRILFHRAGRALRADHALVQRVRRVAVDVADLAVAQVHANAAAAGAHVAGGVACFAHRPCVRVLERVVQGGVGHRGAAGA